MSAVWAPEAWQCLSQGCALAASVPHLAHPTPAQSVAVGLVALHSIELLQSPFTDVSLPAADQLLVSAKPCGQPLLPQKGPLGNAEGGVEMAEDRQQDPFFKSGVAKLVSRWAGAEQDFGEPSGLTRSWLTFQRPSPVPG